MSFEVTNIPLGPMANNAILLTDTDSLETIIVDPTFDIHRAITEMVGKGYKPVSVWLTHAHFDHVIGAIELANRYPGIEIALHPADEHLYSSGGGAANFGIDLPSFPKPTRWFVSGEIIDFHGTKIEIRHAPGHSPGHVLLYIPSVSTLISGDVIFNMGIGRTDLDGGDPNFLLQNIYKQVFTLPDETKILPGHGPETTVGFEKQNNPWLAP